MDRLPSAPPPLLLHRPDGRSHRLRFRIWRAPTGIEVELEEMEVTTGEGFQFAVLGDHDADVEDLLARVTSLAEREVARQYLEPSPHRVGWMLFGDEVAGRLVWNDEGHDGRPYDAVVDGGMLTWEELGHALESFEGWNFRLTIEESSDDARTDAQIIELEPKNPRPDGG